MTFKCHWYILICIFLLSCNHEVEKKHGQKVITWSEDIAEIIYNNCTVCHRPGESGTFNLLTYSDAIRKAKLIKFVTQSRYMPPWPADPEYSHFIGERVLSEQQIESIKDWVEGGTLRGDSLKEPPLPEFYTGSAFGKPDLVIKAQQAVLIKGNGTDVFLIMKYPYQLDKDTILDFAEFVPHRRKLVHHVNGHLVNYDAGRSFNYMTGESVFSDTKTSLMEVYSKMHIPYIDLFQPNFPTLTMNTVYYLPGYTPPVYPEALGGYKMKKNGLFLLNNIHYGPSNADLVDSSYINVFFRKTPIQRPVTETQLGTFGVSDIEPEFVIPAGQVKTFHTHKQLTRSISLLSVNPHMHLLGKSFLAFAIKPNGDTLPIVRIKKWDFRWQYYYTFKNPLKIEAGSSIHVYGTYDNTSSNPNNPFFPPQDITQGNGVESMKTSEEMFQFIFTYVPYKEGDERIKLERTPEK
jgi:hypothetical protein